MPVRPEEWRAESRALFAGARDPKALATAVDALHRRVDEVVAISVKGHAVPVACARGCHLCCSMQVQVQPHEAFALAAWLRRNFTAARLEAVLTKLRENAARTEAMGPEARKRANLPCALLDDDGACSAYEARPAQCRKFHSMRLATCEASFANPADDAIASPEHPAVAHNADVIATQARHAARDAGLDAGVYDLNGALLEKVRQNRPERGSRRTGAPVGSCRRCSRPPNAPAIPAAAPRPER